MFIYCILYCVIVYVVFCYIKFYLSYINIGNIFHYKFSTNFFILIGSKLDKHLF